MTWSLINDYPGFALLLLGIFVLAVLYLVRAPAHRALEHMGRLAHRLLRSLAHAARRGAATLARGNREAVAGLQRELVQRQLEREFRRLGGVVERDTAGFRRLQRDMHEHLEAIEADFEHSGQVPPSAPDWVAAVDAVGRLPGSAAGESIGRILQDMHGTVQEQQREAMREYRWTTRARHKILLGMRPHWRALARRSEDMLDRIDGLNRRIAHVDQLMGRFEALCAGGRVRFGPAAGRFVLSCLAMLLAVAGVVLNIELLQRPLAEILPGETLGPVALASFIAAVLTLAMVGLGVILCEALQLTRLLPLINGLSARARAATCLLVAGLLAGVAVLESLLLSWWVSSGLLAGVLSLQVAALLGLLLPPLLAVSALVLETFLLGLRPVLGWVLQYLLEGIALVARLLGGLCLELGRLAVQLYDVVLFLPLALERILVQRRAAAVSRAEESPVTPLTFERGRKAAGGD